MGRADGALPFAKGAGGVVYWVLEEHPKEEGMTEMNRLALCPLDEREQRAVMEGIRTHARELEERAAEIKERIDSPLARLYAILDYELAYLQDAGQDRVARVYLLAIHQKDAVFDINRYPLHTLLIDCAWRARDAGELRQELSGGFVWQILVDALQSHLLDWLISPVPYDMRTKLMGHLRKLLPLLA